MSLWLYYSFPNILKNKLIYVGESFKYLNAETEKLILVKLIY